MRIRKRQAPLPFASISPVPLSSDPNFNRSPTVQLPRRHQHPPLPTPCFDPRYSPDHPNHPIGHRLQTQGHDSSALPGKTANIHGDELKNKKEEDYLILKQGEGEKEESGEGEKGNDTRKKSVLGEELGSGSVSERSSSSHQAVGRWGEGEKAFPLKKRRGSFQRRGNDDDDDYNDTIMEKDNKRKVMINTNKIMKTKMNKKSVRHQQQNDNQQEEKESKDYASSTIDCNNDDNNHPSSAKKRGRGGTRALREGSRCSRVNGRGWRCCQQTLVGYSLCEHHLGKGRLRSMTSVRSRSSASSSNNNAANEEKPIKNDHEHRTLSNCSSPSQQAKQTKRESLGDNGDDEDQEDQKPLMMTKKRVKLGVVKARSISSLLGQNDNVIAVADNNN